MALLIPAQETDQLNVIKAEEEPSIVALFGRDYCGSKCTRSRTHCFTHFSNAYHTCLGNWLKNVPMTWRVKYPCIYKVWISRHFLQPLLPNLWMPKIFFEFHGFEFSNRRAACMLRILLAKVEGLLDSSASKNASWYQPYAPDHHGGHKRVVKT